MRRVCLTVHAERLHEDPVWRAVERLLDRLERRSGHATFLVSPLRASAAGVELGGRLREVVDRGHEVGQHTHYYPLTVAPGGRITFEKRADASPENLRRCLDHDYARLLSAGVHPRGFVSGAWAVHDEVVDWLLEHGFEYDLSFRRFPLGYHSAAAARGAGCDTPFVHRGLLAIPTTNSLARAVRDEIVGRREPPRIGGLPYDVIYVHDYDLTDVRRRVLLATLDRAVGAAARVTVSELKTLVAAGLVAA